MKKNLLWTLLAALTFVGCSEDELLEGGGDALNQNAVTFGTYVSGDAQSRATVVDNNTLKTEGFGVNAWYTKADDYETALNNSTTEAFMTKTKVTFNEEKGWIYSPLKYWPNNKGHMVSFFAYGPYSVSEFVDGTDIEFTVADDVKQQVDLIYHNQTANETIDIEKPAVGTKVEFKFDHALSRISFSVEAASDVVSVDPNTSKLDGNTVINVKKVVVMEAGDETTPADPAAPAGPFYKNGTLSLVDGTWNDKSTDFQGFTFTGEHFYRTVKADDIAKDPTEVIDVVQLHKFNNKQDLLNDESYLMIIPNNDDEKTEFNIYIEYDVITETAEGDDVSKITNCITSDEPLEVEFKQGMAYNFNLVLGMTSVQFNAEVTEWNDATGYENEEWLPENVEAELQYNTESTVFEIYNDKQLARMRDLVNDGATYTIDGEGNVTTTETRSGGIPYAQASYILMDDIDLSGYDNWEPIGLTGDTSFKGTFNGNGKSITGYNINITDTEYEAMKDGYNCYIGLFNNVNDATIKNLIAQGAITTQSTDIVTWVRVGGIAGFASNSKIYNCRFSGTLTNGKRLATIGGIVGSASGYVVRCTTTGVTLQSSADNVVYGGIAGSAPTTIAACYTYGNDYSQASNLSLWGGIVGEVYNHPSDHCIESCYNYDAVSSSVATYVGAILGKASSSSGQYLANCYSVAMDGVTAVVGHADNSPKDPINCDFVATDGDWTNARNVMNNALIELNDLDEGSNKYGFYNLKFEESESGAAYPLEVVDGLAEYVAPDMSGRGTAEAPYLIWSAEQLKAVRDNINDNGNATPDFGEKSWNEANYKLMKDIDLSTVCSEELGTWIPIENLEGGFDGNDKTIKNLYIYNGGKSTYDCGVGLFGDINLENGGKIQNLNVEGSILVNEYVSCVGGIVGRLNYSKLSDGEAPASIENCTFKGTITIEKKDVNCAYHIGGIVGQNNYANIMNCHTLPGSKIVSEYLYVGGITGYTVGNIIGCSNAATISATRELGGIVGCTTASEASCYTVGCYNIGEITCTGGNTGGNTGGIVGRGEQAKIISCYNAGNVKGGPDTTGGINGQGSSYNHQEKPYGSIIVGCYNIGEITTLDGSATKAIVGNDKSRIIESNYYSGTSTQEGIDGISEFGTSDYKSDMNAAISNFVDDTAGDSPEAWYPTVLPLDVTTYINTWQYTTEGATATMPLRLINSTLGIE